MAADLLLARPLLPPPDPPSVAVTTDASDWGWGAALSPAEAPFHPEAVEQARWPPPGTQLIAPTAVEIVDFLSQGAEPVPPAEPRLIHAARILDRAWAGRQPRPHETRVVPHSTEKESAAVLWGLLSFARQLRRGGHRFVLIRSDNIVALAAVARGWSSAASISRAAMLISFTARWLGLRLIPVHVPGVDNVLADEASRGWLPSNLRGRAELDWPCDGNVLKEELARHQCWLPEIDAFASFNNFKCKAFWSLRHEPGAAATDAMAQKWCGKDLLLNPPFAMAASVVRKLTHDRPRHAIVLLPDFPSASWYKALTDISSKTWLMPPSIVATGDHEHYKTPLTNPRWLIRAWEISC
jgi:hypothetical protein